MSELNVSKSYYLKAYDLPVNTYKSIAYIRLKKKIPNILITQSTLRNFVIQAAAEKKT